MSPLGPEYWIKTGFFIFSFEDLLRRLFFNKSLNVSQEVIRGVGKNEGTDGRRRTGTYTNSVAFDTDGTT